MLEHSDTDLDLAALVVLDAKELSIPELPWQSLSRPDNLATGSKVFPIGYPEGNPWFKSIQPHLVSNVTNSLIRAEGNLVPGHSGGALVTEQGGIVGLVTRVDPLLGESTRIDRIVEKLTEWGYRVQLTFKPQASATTRPGRGGPDVEPSGGRGARLSVNSIRNFRPIDVSPAQLQVTFDYSYDGARGNVPGRGSDKVHLQACSLQSDGKQTPGTSCVISAPIRSTEGTQTIMIPMQFGSGSYTSSSVQVCLWAETGDIRRGEEIYCEKFEYSKRWTK
jgi:hypothetical protein